MARWMAGNGKGTRPDLKKVQEILGLGNGSVARDDYESDGHFAYPADTADFDPDYIEDELGPSRYEEISNGLEPTPEELEIWAKKRNSLVFEEDGGWYHFYLWKVELSDEQIYFRSLHGDGGILDCFDGPFENEDEALIDAGNLEFNPRL
jgi:hypothetical protein